MAAKRTGSGYTGVRVQGRGIEIRWHENGKPKSYYINKTPNATNLKNAAGLRKRIIEDYKRGESFHSRENLTWQDCCERMLAHKEKSGEVKASTLRSYQSKLEVYFSGIAELMIADIKLHHLREIDRSTDWSHPKTRNNAFSAAKQVFKFALQEDLIDVDPSTKIESQRYQKKEIDSFTAEEAEAIIEALEGKYKLFYTIMFDNGLRTGEVQGLQWTDWKDDSLKVERNIVLGEVTTTKTHQARTVYLSPRTVKALKAAQGNRFKSKWIIDNGKGEPYYTDNRMTVHFKRACEKAGVRYRRPYNARHTYVTKALTAGVNMITVAKQIGDRLETMQRNYADVVNAQSDKSELAKAHEV